MSGEQKKRIESATTSGWEEAGGEFYQECFPGLEGDLEVMKQDPHRISTLLPSKKLRTTTYTKTMDLQTLRYRTTVRTKTLQHQSTLGPNNDVEIALMPDLSENLSNEELLWEEITKIKAIPVNMAQKKEMKTKLENKDILRLQGFKKLQWKMRQLWIKQKLEYRDISKKLTIWNESFKKIEQLRGKSVCSFFKNIKWLIFLNIIISAIISVLMIISIANNPTNPTNQNTTTLSNDISSIAIDTLVGRGWMTSQMPFYYNYYDNNTLITYNGNVSLDMSLLYFLLIFLCILIHFCILVIKVIGRLKYKLIRTQGIYYPYCNLIFSGWDFSLINQKCAINKHDLIKNHIMKKNEKLNKKNNNYKNKLIEFFINFIILIICILLSIFINYVVLFFFDNKKENFLIVINNELINEYLPPFFLILISNYILPFLINFFNRFENTQNVKLYIFRNLLGKIILLYTFLASFLIFYANDDNLCVENLIGKQLYKLFLLIVLFNFLITFFLNFPIAVLSRYFGKLNLIRGNKFDISLHLIDIAYLQIIIWISIFYAPFLPILSTIYLIVLFYIKKFTLLINNDYCTYYGKIDFNSNLFIWTLWTGFVSCIFPWIFVIFKIKPSIDCGPFKNYENISQVIYVIFKEVVVGFNSVSPILMIPICVILSGMIGYYYVIYKANKDMVLVLKKQLILEGHDKQFLLNRLSAFIRQQQRFKSR